MRSGMVELRSGRWDWSLQPTALGSKVVFRRWGSGEEEMVSWVPEYELTPESAREAALDPLHRVWVDGVGLAWQVGLEAPRPWRMQADPLDPVQESDSVALVFARGWSKRAALVPKTTRLGELTQAELIRLFDDAGAWK